MFGKECDEPTGSKIHDFDVDLTKIGIEVWQHIVYIDLENVAELRDFMHVVDVQLLEFHVFKQVR